MITMSTDPSSSTNTEDDIFLSKTSSGVFNSTNIDYALRNRGAENVVVAGFLSDQCVDMAIRDGADRGYYMVCAIPGGLPACESDHV